MQGQGRFAAVQDTGRLVPARHPESGRRGVAIHGRVLPVVERAQTVGFKRVRVV